MHPGIAARAPRVVGLDPGFAAMGYSVVELDPIGERVIALGVLRTQKSPAKRGVFAADDNLRRSRELACGLERLLAAHHIVTVCAEAMSHPRNASTAAKLSLAWGVLAALTARDLPLVQATPQAIRKSLCGRHSASKGDVQYELLRRYGNGTEALLAGVPESLHEHAYDALGAVVACLTSDTVRLARAMFTTAGAM